MKYFLMPEAGLAIEYHCNSDRYLEMENPSPMAGYPVRGGET